MLHHSKCQQLLSLVPENEGILSFSHILDASLFGSNLLQLAFGMVEHFNNREFLAVNFNHRHRHGVSTLFTAYFLLYHLTNCLFYLPTKKACPKDQLHAICFIRTMFIRTLRLKNAYFLRTSQLFYQQLSLSLLSLRSKFRRSYKKKLRVS